MESYRGALIGLGNVALNGHIPAWKKSAGLRIVAGVDSSADQRSAFKKLMPESVCCSSLDECDNLNLDFVDICTPPHTHFPLVQKALEKKLNVICEKPLVLSEKDFESLEAAAGKNSKVLLTVHNWKYAPICLKLSELVDRKVIGDVTHCAWFVLRNGPARTALEDKNNWRLDPTKSGGGILVDHGWHAFYLVLRWMNSEPMEVAATLENRQYADLPVEDTAKIKIEFDGLNGVPRSAEVFLTWASRLRRNWGVIEGTEGTIQIEDDSLKVSKKNRSDPAPEMNFKFDAPLSGGSHHPDWFLPVIDEFSKELHHENTEGANLKIAGSCLKLIERSKESSSKGTPVLFSK